jgi:hypothetical protein
MKRLVQKEIPARIQTWKHVLITVGSAVASEVCFTMAVYTVFTEYIRYEYKSTVCSKATLFISVILILTIISPLLIAYRSYGIVMLLEKWICSVGLPNVVKHMACINVLNSKYWNKYWYNFLKMKCFDVIFWEMC